MKKIIYRIFLKQNIIKINIVKVSVGDEVFKGTVIGTCDNDGISTDIHSSVHGIIINVTEDYIDIENLLDESEEYIKIKGNSNLDLIKNAGIVGMGGAGFPTYIKLSKRFDKDGILIINGAECEPILSHNIKRIEQDCDRILKGAIYAAQVIKASKIVVVVKEKNKKAIEILKDSIGNRNIELHLLKDIYPIGEERAVIREVTGNLLSPYDLPYKVDTVVINVETALRIQEAIDYKKPVITKDLTIAGEINNEKRIHVLKDVPIGMKVEDILNSLNGTKKEYGEIILGGPFTGKRGDINSFITKTTGGIIVTSPFFNDKRKAGILVCACGADKERLQEIADSMDAEVVAYEYCKHAIKVKGTYKCENPGKCPGQAQKVLNLKKQGAEILIISNCSDCTNTVMTIAPKLKLPVYHCTDGALRSVGMRLIRKLKV